MGKSYNQLHFYTQQNIVKVHCSTTNYSPSSSSGEMHRLHVENKSNKIVSKDVEKKDEEGRGSEMIRL